ncbi:unnamed protein product [Pedinophyceae sp. YPF-701]|nr:unnamed protein product [Pedinophyceae sp. YPF-701]
MIRVGGRFTRPARIFVVTPSAAAPERPSEASATEAEAPGTLIVDPAFKTLVRVAHPTPEYERVLDGMPDVFVGSPQRLERTMAYLSTFVRSSFAANGTDVPPWRRLGSMLERWTRARSYEDRRPSLDTTAQDARPRCAVPCDDKGQLHYHTGPVTSPTYFGFLPCGNFVTPRH